MPIMPKDFRISIDPADIDLDAYNNVWTSVGLPLTSIDSYPDDFMDRLFDAGAFGFFAFIGDELVGLARVISDDIVCAWLGELCIHKEWHGKGLGTTLLEAVNERFTHVELHVHAIVPRDTFYQRWGISQQLGLVGCARSVLTPDANRQLNESLEKTSRRRFSNDPNDINGDALCDLYRSVGRMRASQKLRTKKDFLQFFGPGVHGFFVFDGNDLAGVARVFSTDTVDAWVADLCVHKDRQKQGFGQELLGRINDHFANRCLYLASPPAYVEFFAGNLINPQSQVIVCQRGPVDPTQMSGE